MADSVRFPVCLYSWISQEDPYKISKCYQMKYWWYAFHDVYNNCNFKKLVRILSSEDCWRRVNNLHGVKLDSRVLGEQLYVAASTYKFEKRFKLACRYCLEDEITTLIHERRRNMSFEDLWCSVDLTKSNPLKNDKLVAFWLHFLEGRIRYLKRDLHVLEYGLQCALEMKQLQAMEFFWRKITELPEHEMSTQRKDGIIMHCAILAMQKCYSRHEIFAFAFSQIKPEKYSDLLEEEFSRNNCFLSLPALLSTLCFEEFKEMFDCLMPSQISVELFCDFLYFLGMNKLYGRYMDAAVSVLEHIWERTGLDEHRSGVFRELANCRSFQTIFLVPLLCKGYAELVCTVFDKASREDVEQYMASRNSELIIDLLTQRQDISALFAFLLYRPYSCLRNRYIDIKQEY